MVKLVAGTDEEVSPIPRIDSAMLYIVEESESWGECRRVRLESTVVDRGIYQWVCRAP